MQRINFVSENRAATARRWTCNICTVTHTHTHWLSVCPKQQFQWQHQETILPVPPLFFAPTNHNGIPDRVCTAFRIISGLAENNFILYYHYIFFDVSSTRWLWLAQKECGGKYTAGFYENICIPCKTN